MKTSSRTSRQNLKTLSKEDKAALDAEAKTIMESFAHNMTQGVKLDSQENIDLLQQHFDWSKKAVTSNKVEYLKMVKNYAKDISSIKALNSIKTGLPSYIKSVALTNISKIK